MERLQSDREADAYFMSKGATHVHLAMYPERRQYCPMNGYRNVSNGVFARHYFNAQGAEIGYVIPDLYPFGTGVEFDTPRVWGIPTNLRRLGHSELPSNGSMRHFGSDRGLA